MTMRLRNVPIDPVAYAKVQEEAREAIRQRQEREAAEAPQREREKQEREARMAEWDARRKAEELNDVREALSKASLTAKDATIIARFLRANDGMFDSGYDIMNTSESVAERLERIAKENGT